MVLKLYPNWKTILKQAWSIRFAILAALFSFAEVFNSLLGSSYLSPGMFALASGFFASAGFISRLVAQKNV
ncbi:MAG TPA: hypothetical protein PL192_06905 [Polynucleobacter sp.]|jgi:hypothetical protein|nr:hypothetical protein [Polynucleobacter sp.]